MQDRRLDMERYKPIKIDLLPTLRVCFENLRAMNKPKLFDITVGDLVSILYIDKLSEIGEGKEYQINCRILDIKVKDLHKSLCKKEKVYMLYVDASVDFNTDKRYLFVSNILDIHEYPYKYELLEHLKLVPDPLTEKFIVHEITHPQDVDMTIPNDPILGYYEYDDEGSGE